VLPNIYDREQLREFGTTCETPALTSDEITRIAELATTNFGIGPETNRYKGTMTQDEYAVATAELSPA